MQHVPRALLLKMALEFGFKFTERHYLSNGSRDGVISSSTVYSEVPLTNVWKVQNTTGRFLSQLHPSNFVLKILFLVPKVSNS